MSGNNRKKTMTREEAEELYRDLQKSMATLLAREAKEQKKEAVAAKKTGVQGRRPVGAARYAAAPHLEPEAQVDNGAAESARGNPSAMGSESAGSSSGVGLLGTKGGYSVVLVLLTFASLKVVIGVLEASGVFSATEARASHLSAVSLPAVNAMGNFSRDEVALLKTLDNRRSELQERSDRIEERERELEYREREFTAKLVKLRDLTASLKSDRERNERRRSAQLDQLANVYGSMHPAEAAPLIQQLDVTIALALLERMPEKRIGQILALMSPERALTLTRLLSGGA